MFCLFGIKDGATQKEKEEGNEILNVFEENKHTVLRILKNVGY